MEELHESRVGLYSSGRKSVPEYQGHVEANSTAAIVVLARMKG